MSESKESSASTSAGQKGVESKMDKTKMQETPPIDPELDILSERFNPLKALYAPSVPLPVQNAPIYNNLAHYESVMKQRQQQHRSGESSVSE